jgi:hypothetical protein
MTAQSTPAACRRRELSCIEADAPGGPVLLLDSSDSELVRRELLRAAEGLVVPFYSGGALGPAGVLPLPCARAVFGLLAQVDACAGQAGAVELTGRQPALLGRLLQRAEAEAEEGGRFGDSRRLARLIADLREASTEVETA